MRPTRFVAMALLLMLANCGPVRIGRQSGSHPANAATRAVEVASPHPPPPVLRSGAADFACAPGAITCVRLNGRDAGGRIVPATFGMPFAPGQVASGATLMASVRGRPVPLQMDERASYPDGSLRFAILSVALPVADAGEVVSLALGDAPAGAAVDPGAWLRAGHDVRVSMNVYSPQVSTITLGDRRGTEPGTPFQPGETITVHLGDDPADTYTVQVTDKTAGGGFRTLSELSKQLLAEISRSSRFRPYKLGEGGGYETLWVTTRGGDQGRPFTVRVETNSRAKVRTDQLQAYEPPRRYTASARAMLDRAGPHVWLGGPVAGEIMLAGPIAASDGTPHPRLTARMNLRVYAGVPQARADVIVEDLWAYDPGPRNWHYDVAIEQDGKAVFQREDLTHFHNARWHKVIWSGADPDLFVQYRPAPSPEQPRGAALRRAPCHSGIRHRG